jgi:hypothetical protein
MVFRQIQKSEPTLIIVQLPVALEAHGSGLDNRLGIPSGTDLEGAYEIPVQTSTIKGTP